MSLIVKIKKQLDNFVLSVDMELTDEIVSVIGMSGSGKSMTLKCIAGIETPDCGFISLNGRVLYDSKNRINLHPGKRRVGYLFQDYALFPTMTVMENICIAMGHRDEQKVKGMLKRYGLDGMADTYPDHLSGGQRQRVAMLRMLAAKPECILLDEPFSALDEHVKRSMESELMEMLTDFHNPVIFVSHNRDEVYRLCDTVCVLNKGKSDPKETVKELFRAPVTMGAALISGCKNISPAKVQPDGTLLCKDWGVSLKTALNMPENTAYVGIRAQYFPPEGTAHAIPCTVERVVENPFSTVVMLQTTGAGRLRWELDKAVWETLSGTEKLTLYVRPEDVMPLTE